MVLLASVRCLSVTKKAIFPMSSAFEKTCPPPNSHDLMKMSKCLTALKSCASRTNRLSKEHSAM